jgi:colanic acid biosynthesis glycosyl transferase WcaI
VRKPRILLITQWFDPEPTFKGLLFARELVKQGFDVEVLTGFPNYPGGKVYAGYRIRPIQRERIDGVEITRVALYPSHNQSAIGRVANYASFALSVILYGVLRARRPDVIYAYHPPLTVGIAAAVIKAVRRVPVLYDIQDLWPDTLRVTGMIGNPRVLSIVGAVCRWVYRRMDRIAVLSPGFKRILIERGVPDEKLDVIYNWADEAAVGDAGTAPPPGFPTEGFRVLFAGNIGKAQALDAVLDAAKLLSERGSRARLVFLGGGVEVTRLSARATELGLGNVVFLPPVPMSQVGAYLNSADALLVHLRKDPLFRITIPSKTQAYMAVGKPIVMGVEGDAADLVTLASCGAVVEPESPGDIAEGIEHLAGLPKNSLETMGCNARAYYDRELSVESGSTRFALILRELGVPSTAHLVSRDRKEVVD